MEWTSDMIDRLRVLWAEGLSCSVIGERMGVSKNAVVGKSRRLQLPCRNSPIISTAWPAGQQADFRAMCLAGATPADLADKFGVTTETVRHHKIRMGLRNARLAAVRAKPETLTVSAAPPRRATSPVIVVRAAQVVRIEPASPVPARAVERPAPVILLPSRVIYARTCQYPTNEGSAIRPWLFCEAPSVRGSYCSAHGSICYSGLRPLRDAA